MERSEVEIIKWDQEKKIIFFKTSGQIYKAKIVELDEETGICKLYIFNTNQTVVLNLTDKNGDKVRQLPLTEEETEEFSCDSILSPISGQVIKIHVKAYQTVKQNEPLVTIESMKMENEIRAPFDLFIKTISISESDLVKQNQLLIEVEEIEDKK